jgi:thiol-disulfide isomerase/thioredoxin
MESVYMPEAVCYNDLVSGLKIVKRYCMSKSKPSAAQRRQQVRQQRQERINTGQNKQARKKRRGSSSNNPWPLIGIILVIVAAVIGLFVFLANQPSASQTAQKNEAQGAFNTITTLDSALLTEVGGGTAVESARQLMHPLPADAEVPKGPTGKPMFLYVGTDWCPNCAAERWAIIIALSRFGKLESLEPLASGEGNIPTYSFLNAKYSSEYLDFVPVETQDNQGKPLVTPTAEQNKLIKTYNAPPYTDPRSQGSVPFVLIGNKQTATGALNQYTTLQGRSYENIATEVKNPNSDIAQNMVGAANYLTAAICQATENQPAKVCNADPVKQILSTLPKAGVDSGGPLLAVGSGQVPAVLRRQD